MESCVLLVLVETEESDVTRDRCFICHQQLEEDDAATTLEEDGSELTVHVECVNQFRIFLRYALQDKELGKSYEGEPDYATLPSIQKTEHTEHEAIMEVLQWAAKNHSKGGLLPRNIEDLLKEHYRWEISNASARLGDLLEQGKVRRSREGRAYRYFVK